MNKVLFGLVIILILSIILPTIFLPVDVLNFFPSFSHGNFVNPKNSLTSDPIFEFEPWRHFAKESFLQGKIPLWNPDNANGVPFFANPQTAVFFPLTVLYYLFPTKISLNLLPLLKIYFFGLFCFFYFHYLKIPKSISLICSAVLATSGFFVFWLLWPHTNVYLFFPLLLFVVEKVRDKKLLLHRWYGLCCFIFFLAVLGGQPETLFFMTIIFACYATFRLFHEKRKAISLVISAIFGFFLAGVVIIPFLEYLLNSYALQFRNQTGQYNFLPLTSFIGNIVPFFLGAPHLPFYKPFSQTTNFQEITGGYVGAIILLTSILGFFINKKSNLHKFWIILIAFSFMAAYGIFPFNFIIPIIPIIKSSSNNRLVAFAAFGLVTLFGLELKEFIKKKGQIKNRFSLWFQRISIFFFIFSSVVVVISFILHFSHVSKTQAFVNFFIQHVFFILASSSLFYILLKMKKSWLLFFPIFLQTTFFFWNYNSANPIKNYYPSNDFIQKLKRLHPGNYLEVGNPYLPPDSNLVYNVKNAESFDAIQIKHYTADFHNSFPFRNQWGKVDRVSKEKLQKFGITYVLSDYNLNYEPQFIQQKYDKLIGPLIRGEKISLSFIPKSSYLSEIRLLPANYNRNNSCLIKLSLYKEKPLEEITKKEIPCKYLLDKMYYTIELNPVSLNTKISYVLEIQSPDGREQNSVGFWGNHENKPYLTFFYNLKNQTYESLGGVNEVQFWKVPGSPEIVTKGDYKIINKDNSSIAFTNKSDIDQNIEIKTPFFPGWVATVDEKATSIINTHPFIGVFVPKGTHLVSLTYKPLSFIIGIFISFAALVIFLFFLAWNESKTFFWQNLQKSWKIKSDLVRKEKFINHVYALSFSALGGVIISLIVNIFILPKSLSVPKTTAINWLTLHNHSMTLDYIRFFTFLFVSIVSIIVGWATIIWRRKH